MAAAPLTTDRKTLRKKVDRLVCDDAQIAANTTIYGGGMVATNAAGALVPASDTAGLTVQGRAPRQMVNSSGAAAKLVPAANVEAGTFKYDNSGTNSIVAADIGKSCYVVDDHTVAKTAGTTNGIVAGLVDSIDADGGIWVRINH